MSIEEWKPILDFDGYEVSNQGRVRSFRSCKSGKLMKGSRDHGGYATVDMVRNDGKIKTRFVHRLVCQAFDSSYSENLTVNHKDGDKLNNDISNLEMMTIQDNIQHYHVSSAFDGVREASQKRGNAKQRGQIYVTNGVDMVRIDPSNLVEWEIKGYHRGVSDRLKEIRRQNGIGHIVSNSTKSKLSESQQNRCWVHNDDEELRVHQDEVNYYLVNGYSLGQSDTHKINNRMSQLEK